MRTALLDPGSSPALEEALAEAEVPYLRVETLGEVVSAAERGPVDVLIVRCDDRRSPSVVAEVLVASMRMPPAILGVAEPAALASLDVGAEIPVDFMTSPVRPLELRARLQALAARRARKAVAEATAQQLARMEDHLDELESLGRIGRFIWDLRTGRVSWSRQLLALYGVPDDYVPSFEGLMSFIPDPQREAVRAQVMGAIERGDQYVFQHQTTTPSGEVRWIEVRGRVELDGRGDAVSMSGTGQDVTDRVVAERETRALQAHQRALFEAIPEAVFLYDADCRRVDVNATACAMYQMTREELLACSSDEISGKGYGALQARGQLERALAGERFMTPWVGRRKDGTTFPAELHVQPLEGPESLRRGVRVISTVRDVTDNRRLEEALRQAQKMESIGRLAGGIAHDFNNLLTVVLSYADMLRQDPSLHEEARDGVLEIADAGRRAAHLTRQLLAFGRRQLLEPTVLDPLEVARSMQTMLQRLLGEHIAVEVAPEDEAGGQAFTEVDRNQLEQVLLNLAVNARDAMPAGGRIRISTSLELVEEEELPPDSFASPGRFVRVCVEDEGMGMDPETLRMAFEPFFTTKPRGEGSGLGLSMVHGLVSQSGGFVRLTSRLGEGTSAVVYLPRAEPATTARVGERHPAPRTTRVARVLVVEDEAPLRTLIVRVLERAGHEVLEAEDGPIALELLERSGVPPVDVLLTDVVMPGVGGRELARRALARHPALRVLYMSGYPDDARAVSELLEEGLDFLPKPFSGPELLRRMERVLETP